MHLKYIFALGTFCPCFWLWYTKRFIFLSELQISQLDPSTYRSVQSHEKFPPFASSLLRILQHWRCSLISMTSYKTKSIPVALLSRWQQHKSVQLLWKEKSPSKKELTLIPWQITVHKYTKLWSLHKIKASLVPGDWVKAKVASL